jgi:hypothetical protein
LLITTPEEADNLLSTKVYDVSDLVVCRDKHDELWDDYDTLIDIIESAARPPSWDDVGGAGAINGASLGKAKVLVVSQTYEAHAEIADLLAQIREVAKKNPDGSLPRRDPPPPSQKKRPRQQPEKPGDDWGYSAARQSPAAPSSGSSSPPAKETKPGAIAPPPCCPGSPGVPPGPGGIMPPGGGGIVPPSGTAPGKPKPPKPDDDSSDPFEPAK